LVEYAKNNGVHDLQVLSKEDVKVLEPNVTCTGGVLSPSTGIIDSHSFMTSILVDAEENGTTLALKGKVNGGRVIQDSSEEKGNIALDVDGSEISCDNVIICAGLGTDRIAASILSSCSTNTDNNAPRIPKQYYAKGNYFKLENQKSPFSRLVYPLPDPKGGLGVHATVDLSNSTRFGPDVEWLDIDNPNDIDMSVDPKRADSFYAAIRKYWPDLQDGNLVPDYCGIRPKLMHPNVDRHTTLQDFMIAGPTYHKVQGLTVLLGIESPGLTSSLAIGNYMAQMID
jgi:L-2-hydroxyglutarate oxidase LhgO